MADYTLRIQPEGNPDEAVYNDMHTRMQRGGFVRNITEVYPDGKHAIDAAVASFGGAIFTHPIVIEGYSDAVVSADALSWSYARAQLVRNYLDARYPFTTKNVGVMPLSSTPPPGLGHDQWSGVSILVAAKK